MSPRDTQFMQRALFAASQALSAGEVPVGAVIVCGDALIATGFNQPISMQDPSAHAEIIALRAAAQTLGNYRLPDCELYVTLEPCLMCTGAILQARLLRVVFGAHDPKSGACGSVINVFANPQLNHHTKIVGGLLDTACAQPLKTFFADKRASTRT